MSDPRSGRRWAKLAKRIIARDHGICWRCGHPGANTAGHVIAAILRPDLIWDPDNIRAEHGQRHTQEADGFDCIGNYAAGSTIRKPPPPRRTW